jgi:hypothetical protein
MNSLFRKIRQNIIYKIYNKKKGLAQIPLMIGLLIMAVALPITARLVQQNTENRSQAATLPPSDGGGTDCKSYGMTDCEQHSTCYLVTGGGYSYCFNKTVSGSSCTQDKTCLSGFCDSGTCKDKAGIGSSCSSSRACSSGNCSNGICTPSGQNSCKDSYSGKVRLPGKSVCGTTGSYTNYLYTCQTNGSWSSGTVCSGGCTSTSDSAQCKATATPTTKTCDPMGLVCSGNNLYVKCDGGGTELYQTCQYGCANAKCNPGPTPSSQCTSDSQCPNYQICSSGKCVASHDGYKCTRDTQCLSTSKCINGVCGKPSTSYTCTTKGGYCTLSTNKHIGVYVKAIDGTCPSGQTCVNCMPADNKCVADPAEPGTYKMNIGGQINTSNGAGCWKTCTPQTYTCNSKGGYCTLSDNKHIGVYVKAIDGTCPSGQTCVNCMPADNKCVADPAEPGTYKMNIGGQINTSNGAGCWKTCTPPKTCDPMGLVCSGNNLYVKCDGGGMELYQTCQYGCANAKCKDKPTPTGITPTVVTPTGITPTVVTPTGITPTVANPSIGVPTGITPTTSPTCSVCSSFNSTKANGDFNCDGKINLVDFSVWKTLYNNSCGKVTLNDFSVWKDKFINQ